MNKHHPEEMVHYNKLMDDIINWECVNFPAGDRDLDRLEVNNDGLISVDVFETDNMFNEEKLSTQEQPKFYILNIILTY